MIQASLDILLDDDGSVTFGSVGERVFLARWSGGMSANLEERFVARLQNFVDRTDTLEYFSDASSLEHYDLQARGDLVRLIIANRGKFTRVVMLTWSEGVSATSQIVAASIGDPVEILTNANEFNSRLVQAAPSTTRVIEATSSMVRTNCHPMPNPSHHRISGHATGVTGDAKFRTSEARAGSPARLRDRRER